MRIILIILSLNIIFLPVVNATDKFKSPESSFISSVSYDAKKQTLSVDMHSNNSKKQYQYNNVDREIFEKFKKSESKGRFFNNNIRSNYDYQRTK